MCKICEKCEKNIKNMGKIWEGFSENMGNMGGLGALCQWHALSLTSGKSLSLPAFQDTCDKKFRGDRVGIFREGFVPAKYQFTLPEYAISDQSNKPNTIKWLKTSFLAPLCIKYA